MAIKSDEVQEYIVKDKNSTNLKIFIQTKQNFSKEYFQKKNIDEDF